MIDFTVYKESGEVLRTGSCQEDDLAIQAQDGEFVVEGHYPDDQYYWDGEFKSIPNKPSENHIFDYQSKTWVINEDMAWGLIRAQRNALLNQSDWTQLGDIPEATKAAWTDYRQQLRDITNSTLDEVVFPDPPQ